MLSGEGDEPEIDLISDVPGFTAHLTTSRVTSARMLPSFEAQSVYSPEQWERMTLTCEDSDELHHTTGIFSQTYFFIF